MKNSFAFEIQDFQVIPTYGPEKEKVLNRRKIPNHILALLRHHTPPPPPPKIQPLFSFYSF